MSEHFSWQKSQQTKSKMPFISQLIKATSFIPSREPPGRGLNNLSKIVNYWREFSPFVIIYFGEVIANYSQNPNC